MASKRQRKSSSGSPRPHQKKPKCSSKTSSKSNTRQNKTTEAPKDTHSAKDNVSGSAATTANKEHGQGRVMTPSMGAGAHEEQSYCYPEPTTIEDSYSYDYVSSLIEMHEKSKAAHESLSTTADNEFRHDSAMMSNMGAGAHQEQLQSYPEPLTHEDSYSYDHANSFIQMNQKSMAARESLSGSSQNSVQDEQFFSPSVESTPGSDYLEEDSNGVTDVRTFGFAEIQAQSSLSHPEWMDPQLFTIGNPE